MGTGSTREEAIQAVCEAAAAQLAYAIETRAPEKVFKPAPKAFYDKWNRAGHRAIMNILVASKTTSRKSPRKYEALELPTSALV